MRQAGQQRYPTAHLPREAGHLPRPGPRTSPSAAGVPPEVPWPSQPRANGTCHTTARWPLPLHQGCWQRRDRDRQASTTAPPRSTSHTCTRAHTHTHTQRHAQMCTHPTQHRDHTPSPVRALPRTGLWPHGESQNSNLTASLMRSEPGTGQPHGWGGMFRAGGGGREVPEHPESLGPHSFCLSEGLGLQA